MLEEPSHVDDQRARRDSEGRRAEQGDLDVRVHLGSRLSWRLGGTRRLWGRARCVWDGGEHCLGSLGCAGTIREATLGVKFLLNTGGFLARPGGAGLPILLETGLSTPSMVVIPSTT